MIIIKFIILILIFFICTYIGILISKKYSNRVKELKEVKQALNIFKTKVELTYEPLPKIFFDISKKTSLNISSIFLKASKNMEIKDSEEAWIDAINDTQTNLNKEDIEVIKGLGNLLGKVDALGQINQINLIDNFLVSQIELAQENKKKNDKLYKTLGLTIGLSLVIVLI